MWKQLKRVMHLMFSDAVPVRRRFFVWCLLAAGASFGLNALAEFGDGLGAPLRGALPWLSLLPVIAFFAWLMPKGRQIQRANFHACGKCLTDLRECGATGACPVCGRAFVQSELARQYVGWLGGAGYEARLAEALEARRRDTGRETRATSS